MLLSDSDKAALIPALSCYVDFPDDFDVEYGVIEHALGDTTHYGVSPDAAYALIQQLSMGNHLIEDDYIVDILSIVLEYKSIVNKIIKDELDPPDELQHTRDERASLNALIRSVKAYCAENDIELDEYELY